MNISNILEHQNSISSKFYEQVNIFIILSFKEGSSHLTTLQMCYYQSQDLSFNFFNVEDVHPGNHILVQNLSPIFDFHLFMATLAREAESAVAGGGPWTATLAKATACSMLRDSLPCVIVSYTLKIPSAGASEKAQAESLISV